MTSTDNQAIDFGVYTGVSTKGLITDNGDYNSSTTASIKDGFGVLGYYQTVEGVGSEALFANMTDPTPNFMWNEEVTNPSGSWTYSPIKYWPNNTNDRLSFMAYAPYQETAVGATSGITIPTSNTCGTPTIKLSLLDAANMVDLVADMKYDLEQDVATEDPSAVSFQFEHLLTRAAFYVVLGGDATIEVQDGTKIFLTQVKLVGTSSKLYDKDGGVRQSSVLYSGGTFTFSTSAKVEDDGLGTWTDKTASTDDINLDGATAGTNSILNFKNNAGETGNDIYIPSGTSATITDAGIAYTIPRSMELTTYTSEATSMFIENNFLFLLPVNETTGLTSAGDVKVYLEYDVVTEDANLYNGHSVVTNYAIVDLPQGSLAKGKAYKYTFTVGLQEVEVSADVTTWGDESTGGASVETDDAITEDPISVTATSQDATDLETALTELNTLAATTTQTTFYVNVSDVIDDSKWLTMDGDCNFEAGDTIVFTFTKIMESQDSISISWSDSSLSFSSSTSESNKTITITVSEA